MKITNVLLLVGLLYLPCFAFSQAPGYLGKKASLSLSFSSFPALTGPTQNNKGDVTFGEGSGRWGFNYAFKGDLSYVIGRYRSLALTFGQYYTGATASAVTSSLGNQFIDIYGDDYHDLFLRINARSVGLTINKFKRSKGALAPVGNNFYYGLKRTFVRSEIIDKKTSFANQVIGERLGHENLGIDQKMNLTYFLFGWSNDRVVLDRFIWKTGFQFAFPLNVGLYRVTYEDKSFDPNYSNNPNQTDYNAEVFDRMVRHELLRINVGIGVLLF